MCFLEYMKNEKIILTLVPSVFVLAFHGFPSYTELQAKTNRWQVDRRQNWQNLEKWQHIEEKTQYLMNSLYLGKYFVGSWSTETLRPSIRRKTYVLSGEMEIVIKERMRCLLNFFELLKAFDDILGDWSLALIAFNQFKKNLWETV